METRSRPLFLFLFLIIWIKSKCSTAEFQYVLIALNLAYDENELYKTL